MVEKLRIDDDTTFASTFLRIQDKQKRLIPLRFNPIQIKLLAGIQKLTLALKPRQVGVTTAIKARYFRLNITRSVSTATLAHDDRTTQALRRMEGRFYDTLAIPPGFPKPLRDLNNATITTYPDFGSESMIVTAGSQSGGRGMTFTHVHGSEFAYWKDADELIAGILQAGDPEIILESTANGATGKFFELCMAALDRPDLSPWTLLFFRWFDDPTYCIPLEPDETLDYSGDELALIEKHQLTPEQIKWRRRKIAEIGTLDAFLQEYPEDAYTCFRKSGIGYFGNVDHALKAPLAPTFDPAHRYVAGLDFGQQQDYTVLIIIDATANQMVHMVRVRHEKWAEMRKAVLNACKAWDVRIMHAEKNSMGSSEIESLYTEFEAAGLRTDIIPFNMTAVNKPSLMAHYRSALHEGGLLLQDLPVIRHELDSAVSKQTLRGWTVESPRDGDSGHGDTVVAGALANYSIGFI